MTLAGKAVVLPVGLSPGQVAAVARRLAAEGAAVVLVTPPGEVEAGEAGRLAADVAERRARTAVMALSENERADLDALVELLEELFP